MRKKTLAVLLAGAVAAAGIIGLTACKDDDGKGNGGNNGTVQSGVEVTEEQWKAAVSASSEATSYTVSESMNDTETASGKVGEETVNYKCIETSTGSYYYDFTNKKILSDYTSTVKTTGGKLFDEEDGEEPGVYKRYEEADGLTLWAVSYYDAETGWTAYSNPLTSEELLETYFPSGMVNLLVTAKFSTTKGGASKTVSELYSAFTYNNGIYSATLYDGDGDENKISVSIKDGYILGIQYELTFDYTQGEITIHSVTKSVYNFSNYGTTSVTAPEGAAAAIAAAKTPAAN